MNKNLKYLLYAGAGIIITGLIVLSFKFLIDNKYRKEIPALPEMQSLSAPLQKQITDARNTAYHSPTARNIGRLGMVFHSSTFYDDAAKCYRLAIGRSRSGWVWNYYLGYIDKEMGDNAGVIENFKKVTDKNPGNWLAWYYIGEGYQSLGQNEKAEEIFNRIISLAPENTSAGNTSRRDYFSLKSYARFQLASIYISTQKTDLAEKTLKELIENQRSFGQAYRLLGSVYSMKGDQVLSKHYVTRAADLMIYTPPVDTIADILARNSLSELYLMKQIDDAEKGGYSMYAAQLLNNALTDMPDDKFIISKAIKIYLLMDLGKLAMPLFDKHLSFFSADINEIKMVADLCMKKGLNEQAIKYYSRAALLRPDDIDVHLSIVLCLGNEGAKQQAVDSVNLLLRTHSNNLKVLTDCAYVMLMTGQKDKASSILAGVRQKYPSDPKVLQLSGILLQQDKKETEAIKMFDSSFRENPQDLSTARYLSDLLVKNKMWGKAIATYTKALESAPNEPYLQEGLGSMYIFCPDEKLRNIPEGKEWSERAFINKSSPSRTIISAGISLSEAYSKLGDKKNAYKTMSMTVQIARREKAPRDFIQNLEKKLEEYDN